MTEAALEKQIGRARKVTVRVITYAEETKGPIGIGMGVLLLRNGRSFVCTSAHVLEKYHDLQQRDQNASVQVSTSRGSAGLECHAGYLLMPNDRPSEAMGVTSQYGHYDVGIIELSSSKLPDKEFLADGDLRSETPCPGEEVLTVGAPYKEGEFDGNFNFCFPELLAQVSILRECSDELLIMNRPCGGGEIDGKPVRELPLEGISGSGVFDQESRLIGLVWGGCEARMEIHICPTMRVLFCLQKYISQKKST